MKKTIKYALFFTIFIVMFFFKNTNAQSLAIVGDSINCASTAYSLANCVAGVTYTWSGTGGVSFLNNTTVGCPSNNTANWGSFSGNFSTFTVTGTNGTSATLIVYDCCGENESPSFINSTTSAIKAWNGGSATVTQDVFINGVLTVDCNLIFDACKVYMGRDAEILHSYPDGVLTFTNSTTVESYCNYMWDGIIITGYSAKVVVNNNASIEDANYSIVSVDGGKFEITNSTLRNNYRDIIVMPFSGTYNSFIKGSTLECTRNLCDPFVNERTNTGITITDLIPTNGWTIGDTTSDSYKNTFSNMWWGIKSTKPVSTASQTLRIKNNLFTKINTSYGGTSDPSAGRCIYYSSNATNGNISYLKIGGTGTYSGNTFGVSGVAQDVYQGIECNRKTNLTVNYNTFINLAKGIYLTNIYRVPVWIRGNTFDEISGTGSFAISTYYTCAGLSISLNEINLNTSTSFKADCGISVSTQAVSSGGYYSSSNVYLNSIKKITTGIYSISAPAIDISANQIYLPATLSAGSNYGILVNSCTSSIEEENYINWENAGNPGASQVSTLQGIRVQQSPSSRIFRNDINKMGSGIDCYGVMNPTTIQCNLMTLCYYGVNLETADIGNQGSANAPLNNQWINNINPYRVFGTLNNSASVNWFYANNLSGNYTVTTTPIQQWYVTGGFGFATTPTPSATPDPCFDMKSAGQQPQPSYSAIDRNDILGNIVQNTSTDSLSLYDVDIYMAIENAYDFVKRNPAILSLGASNDKKFSAYFNLLDNSSIGKFYQLNYSIANSDYVAAKTAYTGLIATNAIEENYLTATGILLNTWAQDIFAFTSADSATLFNIALQHPITAGKGVYLARAMLGLMVSDNISENNLKMQNSGNSISENSVILYPVPAKGELNFLLPNADSKTSETLKIYNALGILLCTKEFTGSNYIMNISGFENGVYYYIIENNNSVTKGNFVVVQ
jgi:hypothetical protein